MSSIEATLTTCQSLEIFKTGIENTLSWSKRQKEKNASSIVTFYYERESPSIAYKPEKICQSSYSFLDVHEKQEKADSGSSFAYFAYNQWGEPVFLKGKKGLIVNLFT